MYFRLHTLERLDLSAGCVLMTSLLHIDTCSWVKRSGTRVMEEMDIYPKTGLRIRPTPRSHYFIGLSSSIMAVLAYTLTAPSA
ncbi:hypothetical protein FOLKNPGA_00197 [Legionella sp. PC1000]|nr:hypothetical protein FOLKNPGA_00197 [Legionella sp. PC1000]